MIVQHSIKLHDVINQYGDDVEFPLEVLKCIMIQSTDTASALSIYDDVKIGTDKPLAHIVFDGENVVSYAQFTQVVIDKTKVEFTKRAHDLITLQKEDDEETDEGTEENPETYTQEGSEDTMTPSPADYIYVIEIVQNDKYQEAEKHMIEYLAKLLNKHDLSTDNIWRRYDLIKDKANNTIQYGKLSEWKKVIDSIKNSQENPDKFKPTDITFPDPDEAIQELDDRTMQFLQEAFAFEVSMEEDFRLTKTGELVSRFVGYSSYQSQGGNLLTYEPIYPDLTVPPRTHSNLYDKRVLDIREEEDSDKVIAGGVVNAKDPYPVDSKIAELQFHHPKIRIETDDIKLNGSVDENLQELKDAIILLSRAVESRSIQLENVISTTSRYLFRLGSRVHINCVYYGGQAPYYKYNSIRCLNDDLTADKEIVQIDQCVNCSRYEPIIGQVYEIVDENMTDNLGAKLDDNQMARANMTERINNSLTEELHDENARANIKLDKVTEVPEDTETEDGTNIESGIVSGITGGHESQDQDKVSGVVGNIVGGHESKDKATAINTLSLERTPPVEEDTEIEDHNSNDTTDESIEETTEEGEAVEERPSEFVMDWTETDIPQTVDINQYSYDPSEILKNKDKIMSDLSDTGYGDVIKNDYSAIQAGFNSTFGSGVDGSGSSDYSFGGGEAREKIVAKARALIEMCLAGKGRYSMPKRFTYGANGVYYLDCSGFAKVCYDDADVKIGGSISVDQYNHCKNKGLMFTDESKAKPGDLVFYKFDRNDNPANHVAIYIGNGRMMQSNTSSLPYTKNWNEGNAKKVGFVAFGTPKALVEADKLTGGIIYQNISMSLDQAVKLQLANGATAQDGSNKKASYKEVLYAMDPNNHLSPPTKYQFMTINKRDNLTLEEAKNFLKNLGATSSLIGNASHFLRASKDFNLSEIYLMAHCCLETGAGVSPYGSGKYSYSGRTIYNMYGIAVYNSNTAAGKAFAYKNNWFTQAEGIYGGAKFIHEKYASKGQNTIYSMRYNMNNIRHQYATDCYWAIKQAKSMNKELKKLSPENRSKISYTIPKFK